MRGILSYLRYLAIHKYYVFVQGRKLGVGVWQLLVHDLSKFRPDEFFPYRNYFYGEKTDKSKFEFDKAFENHTRRNRHHWNFWDGDAVTYFMPCKYVREMLADWSAMARQQGKQGDVTDWYYSRRDKIKLHPDSRTFLEALGYESGLMLVDYDYWKKVQGVKK